MSSAKLLDDVRSVSAPPMYCRPRRFEPIRIRLVEQYALDRACDIPEARSWEKHPLHRSDAPSPESVRPRAAQCPVFIT